MPQHEQRIIDLELTALQSRYRLRPEAELKAAVTPQHLRHSSRVQARAAHFRGQSRRTCAGGCLLIDGVETGSSCVPHRQRHGLDAQGLYCEHGNAATIGTSCDQVRPGELSDLAAIPARRENRPWYSAHAAFNSLMKSADLAVVVVVGEHPVNLSLHSRTGLVIAGEATYPSPLLNNSGTP
jgi:hypothetical protein